MSTRQLVQKLWSYCQVLRDDGVSTLDYIQQLTFLLFLKMADEQTKAPWNRPSPVPDGLDWPSLLSRTGDDLEAHYIHVLRELGRQPGMLGQIYRKAQNKVQDPARLSHLIKNLIDTQQWSSLDVDVKGDAYEGLLDKGVADGGAGAGQYFTPRSLIRSMVKVMQPGVADTVFDPACGTAGVPPGRPRVRRHERRTAGPRRAQAPVLRVCHGVRARRRHRPAGRDEHAPARHRDCHRSQPHHHRGRATRRPGQAVLDVPGQPALRTQVVRTGDG